jgi:alpha-ribazole phosphatase
MRILFIRHGKTLQNTQKKYIGCRTDESLCSIGIKLAKQKRSVIADFAQPDIIFSSPMKRCIETAEILFPNQKYIVENDFREIDFGDFEGKNYIELSDDINYCKWIESGGTLPFPNGESREDYIFRVTCAFKKILEKYDFENAAFVVHGGTVMSVLSEFEISEKGYFEWSIENCGIMDCEVVSLEPLKLKILEIC